MPPSIKVTVGKEEDAPPVIDRYIISDHKYKSTNEKLGYFQIYLEQKDGGIDFGVNFANCLYCCVEILKK